MQSYSTSLIRKTIWLIPALLIGLSSPLLAQERVVSVEPGIGTLNEAINSDTTDTGERIEPDNTVYELEAGEGTAKILFSDGSTVEVQDRRFDRDLSKELFSRSGRIQMIQVGIPRDSLQ